MKKFKFPFKYSLRFPRRFCAFLAFALANAAIFSALRVIFYLANKPAEAIAPNLIMRAFTVGARFDLRIAFLLALPLGILLLLPYKKWYKKTFAAVYAAAFAALMLLYFIDFGYYAYLAARLNAYIFALAADTGDSLLMAWQTYPVIKAALLLLALAAAY